MSLASEALRTRADLVESCLIVGVVTNAWSMRVSFLVIVYEALKLLLFNGRLMTKPLGLRE